MPDDSIFRCAKTTADVHSHDTVQAIIVDWAGTIVDFGSRAPAKVFVEIFRQRGIEVSDAQARAPMGMSKRDHIMTIAQMPQIASQWQAKFGKGVEPSDIDLMYAEFLPLQLETLKLHGDVIPGAVETFQACRTRGMKIGSSTGYTQALMEVVTASALERGLQVDALICADDVPAGRPAPWMCFEAAKRLGVYPLRSVVKIDDTTVGIEAGRNAGCWTVGVTASGNLMGLSEQEWHDLRPAEKQDRLSGAEQAFLAAGAHYTIESVSNLMHVIDDIDRRLNAGERP